MKKIILVLLLLVAFVAIPGCAITDLAYDFLSGVSGFDLSACKQDNGKICTELVIDNIGKLSQLPPPTTTP